MTVVFTDGRPNGLAEIVGELIRQNLERDPRRFRLLRPAVATIEVPDAGVATTIRVTPQRVEIANARASVAHVRIRAGSGELLRMTGAPLRLGLPDPLRPAGRALIGDLVAGRIGVKGLVRHPVRTARLSMLLSVA